jgi:hypothetical protein
MTKQGKLIAHLIGFPLLFGGFFAGASLALFGSTLALVLGIAIGVGIGIIVAVEE